MTAVHGRRITDTPPGAPQARCNCGHEDEGNRPEWMNPEPKCLNDAMYNPEVADKGAEGNRAIQTNETKYAFVLHVDGTPLMPMRIGKAKQMVRDGKSVVAKCKPLVIKLTYETTKNADELVLGIDTGYVHIGYSVVNPRMKREYIRGVLEQEHTKTDSNPVKTRLYDRRMYRRNRRNRLWHREPRFENRKIRNGILPPSVERKYRTHLHLVEKLKKFLPIGKVVVEVAKFDIQNIKSPEIEGTGYQQGDLYGYNNVRSYLMARERGRCQLCGETFEGRSSHIHHVIPRSKGGTDKPDNLAILHAECHEKLHREGLLGKLSKSKQYKDPAFMAIINKRFWDDIENLDITYGNITFTNRTRYGIWKSHSNDAFVIAGGDGTYSRSMEENLTQKRRNDRRLQWNNIKRKGSGGAGYVVTGNHTIPAIGF